MKKTYEGSQCCVKLDVVMTDWFTVLAGVRQSCIWSPLLFGSQIDWVLKNALDKSDMEIVLGRWRSSHYHRQRPSDLHFANNIAEAAEWNIIGGTERRKRRVNSKRKEDRSYANIQGANPINHQYGE